MPSEVDVAIIGFGPTGATLANLLGRDGIRSLVVEREPELHNLPRAVHFDHEAMRTFQALTLSQEILPFTGPIQGYEFRNAEGALLLSFDVRSQIASQGWWPDYMFHQPSLERVLRDGARRRAPVEVRLGQELVALSQDRDGVTLTLRDAESGAESSLRSRYVVGCDGASSPTREQAGLPIENLEFDEPWLVVDATIDRPATELGLPAMPFQLCDPKRPTTFIPVVGPYIRWEFMLLPGEGAEMKERALELIADWVDPEQVRLIRAAVYRFHALIGARWRDRRVLVAGDAAHQMPPFLGQGMCAGIRDAANLAWKLALVLRGAAGDALLDSYQRERAPHVRQVIDISIGMGRVICTLDPEAAAARDARMLGAEGGSGGGQPAAMPPLLEGFLTPTPRHPLVGGLGLQARVRAADGRVALLDDHLGPGAALLWNGAPAPLSAKARDAAARLGARQVVIVPPDGSGRPPAGVDLVLEDVDEAYGAWFRSNAAAFVLVRPDFAIYDAAAAPEAASPMLEALAAALDAA